MAYLDMPLGEFLSALRAAGPAPGGGGAAALTVALGASLCAMSARLSARQLTEELANELTTTAQRLATRSASLIQADADSYQQVLAERRRPAGAAAGAQPGHAGGAAGAQLREPAADVAIAERRQQRIAEALSAAAGVPMQVIEIAVDVGRLAARLATDGNPNLRGDAVTAALLADAGARAAGALVMINLAGTPEDARRDRVRELLLEVAESAAAAQLYLPSGGRSA